MSVRYVCDTSVLVKWFNEENEQFLDQAKALRNDWKRGSVELITCDLAVWELANALQKGKGLSAHEVKDALAVLFDLPLDLLPPYHELAEMTADLAAEHGMASYDASFIALAKLERCRLITANPKHQGKVKDGTILPLAGYPVIPPN